MFWAWRLNRLESLGPKLGFGGIRGRGLMGSESSVPFVTSVACVGFCLFRKSKTLKPQTLNPKP